MLKRQPNKAILARAVLYTTKRNEVVSVAVDGWTRSYGPGFVFIGLVWYFLERYAQRFPRPWRLSRLRRTDRLRAVRAGELPPRLSCYCRNYAILCHFIVRVLAPFGLSQSIAFLLHADLYVELPGRKV